MSGYDDWLAAPYDDAPECPDDCGEDWCNCAEELAERRAEEAGEE